MALSLLILVGCGTAEEKGEFLYVTFLKAGKADAIVLRQGEDALLIDAGEEDDGQKLLEYLKRQGIEAVQRMIITHFDKDHVGGADWILENLPVNQVLTPDYEGAGKQYRQYREALLGCSGTEVLPVTGEQSFSFAGAQVTVYPSALTPEEILDAGEEEYDNELSLAVRVVHGENTLLFAGDAEEQRIREMVGQMPDSSCDLLKMPHHGRWNAETATLLDAVQPKEAVICCSDKHPAQEETVALLEERNIRVWMTKDGNIEVISDGASMRIVQ